MGRWERPHRAGSSVTARRGCSALLRQPGAGGQAGASRTVFYGRRVSGAGMVPVGRPADGPDRPPVHVPDSRRIPPGQRVCLPPVPDARWAPYWGTPLGTGGNSRTSIAASGSETGAKRSRAGRSGAEEAERSWRGSSARFPASLRDSAGLAGYLACRSPCHQARHPTIISSCITTTSRKFDVFAAPERLTWHASRDVAADGDGHDTWREQARRQARRTPRRTTVW